MSGKTHSPYSTRRAELTRRTQRTLREEQEEHRGVISSSLVTFVVKHLVMTYYKNMGLGIYS